MLDLRFIRTHPEKVKEAMAKRNTDAPVAALLAADDRWRRGLAEVERLKAERNDVSRHIGELKRSGDDATEALERMKTVAARIKALDDEVAEAEADVQRLLFDIPNITHDSVPTGVSDDDNVELKRVGEPRSFSFTPSAHWDIGTSLGILDFERAGKLAGARFSAFKGVGARLERALIQFMLDLHIDQHGYTELMTPVIANREAMTATGQLPKFAEDMFRLEGLDYYLIPTAEVSMTNWHRDEILTADALPKYYVGYTPCFRAEAGAHGRDTRGLIRNHQFDKVELVKLCMPEHSYDELEKLTANAEKVLELLALPYRRVVLCSGDTGFSAAKTYDLEVWMPSYDRYVEISSCSNFEDFQARRARLRFRRQQGEKAELVHTLNGSGLAVGRTFAAVLENYQNEDGTVNIPEALRPYMGGMTRIEKAEES